MNAVEPTNAETYVAAMKSVLLAGSIISQWDLPGMLASIALVESVGPLLDPTSYRDKCNDLFHDRDLLKAALPLWEFCQRYKQNNATEEMSDARRKEGRE